MKNRDVVDALNNIDFDLIEDAGRVTRKMSMRRKVARWSSFAACVCLVVVALVLISHYANGGGYVDTDVYVDDVIYGTLSDEGGGNASVYYAHFERICYFTNEVISARYLGGRIEDGKCYLEFQVLKRYKGDIEDETVVLRWRQSYSDIRCVKMAGASGTSIKVPFTKGKSYLLLLYHEAESVYSDEHYGMSCPYLIIPLNQIQNSVMYGVSLSEFMDNPKKMKSASRLIRYVKRLTKHTPDETIRFRYVDSTALADIVEASTHVLKVKVIKDNFHNCIVTKGYKGEWEPQDHIDVMFPHDSEVKEGEEWIIIVQKETGPYYFTSRHGILNVSREEEIIELLSKKQ